ncbi:sigma 54-interacting transcriptional regulator [Desulfosporosinus sp. BICA1-9]|uniref:sigma 54-interacting transcriptional regulator n=1 Tax=Desulfosporosinus sp. BICA1-9 TaxID=1531958 RepID=UPI0005F13C5E|nr:sigma 54-interacting transcriptional regulator [Desulfosporosinus sp. BICA1-9]KJS49645.1 MAG: Fis family transcriptional regulator [Peptococcaceae bacterium BRH_c23]KJS86047.1 MAG: Fis family transcriptional regulator [Desulfosporosinus sp. BICA1-9]HBW34895.1 PAS domain S-box protein [Desulfosporosinus sp.]
MVNSKAVIKHNKGLHTRVAAMVVQKSQELQEKYKVSLYFHYQNREKVLANSLIPLVSLRIKAGDELWVSSSGEMAETAIAEMVEFLESDFLISDVDTINKVDNVLQNNSFTAEHVFNSMANGLLVIDENDIITVFNPAAEKIIGIAAADVVGKNVYESIPDTRLPLVNKTMVPELGCRQVISNSVIITNRTPIIVEGQSKGAVAIFEDISSLENITHELREVKELKERLHLILESVQDGICVVDKLGYITYVNPAYLRITQIPIEKLVGQNIARLAPRGSRSKALVTGKPVLGNICCKPNGQTIVSNVNPIIVDGELAGVVSVIKKISEVQAVMDKLNEVTARAEYLEQELRRTRKPVKAFDKFIGRSGKVLDALAVAAKAAEGHATVLIRGESGTGKELVAEGIHFASRRVNGPFIRVNCAAIPVSLLESELFGHEKGAFTGALRRKLGNFELADKGTIFLDEIGDMEKNMQAKILRVLQKKEFQRVGGEEMISVDVKIIAATHRDLEKMVLDGGFREDLYYRLNIIPIILPPLRERKEDIPLLVEYFFNKMCSELGKKVKGLRQDALEVLMRYRWPGNVRELENIMERVITLTEEPYIGVDALPTYLREELIGGTDFSALFTADETILPWDAYEKTIINMALKKYGSFNKAAKVLGLTHKTVAAKARKYNLEKSVTWEKKMIIGKKYQAQELF